MGSPPDPPLLLPALGPRPPGRPRSPGTPAGSRGWSTGSARGSRTRTFALLYPRRVRPPRRHQLLLGVGPAAVRREPGDARPEHRDPRSRRAWTRWPSTPWPRIRTSPGGSCSTPPPRPSSTRSTAGSTPVGYASRGGDAARHGPHHGGAAAARREGIPVLLVGGDRDPSLAPMRVMRRKIPGSRLVLVLLAGQSFANRERAGGVEPDRAGVPRRAESGAAAPAAKRAGTRRA